MDLSTMRKSLAEKEATRGRIAAELARVREALSGATQATREAQARSREAAIAAVLANTDAARAEEVKAKEALIAAFERETALRDRVPVLDHAIGQVQPDIESLRAALRRDDEARLLEAVSTMKEGAIERCRQAIAELVVARHQGGPVTAMFDLGDLEQIVGRRGIVEQAQKISLALRERVLGRIEL